VSEAFLLGNQDYRLPGIGAYMSLAVEEGDWGAVLWAVAAMTAVIVALDQFVWRPLGVWAQKFRVEEGAGPGPVSSWFLEWLRCSRLRRLARVLLHRWAPRRKAEPPPAPAGRPTPEGDSRTDWQSVLRAALSRLRWSLWLALALLAPLAYGAW